MFRGNSSLGENVVVSNTCVRDFTWVFFSSIIGILDCDFVFPK